MAQSEPPVRKDITLFDVTNYQAEAKGFQQEKAESKSHKGTVRTSYTKDVALSSEIRLHGGLSKRPIVHSSFLLKFKEAFLLHFADVHYIRS